MTYLQDMRLIRMNTSLGKDRLFVSSFSGTEALSTLFSFNVKAFSSGSFVQVAALVGQPIVVSILTGGSDDRHVHGYIRQAELEGYDYTRKLYHYTIDIVPWLWFLTCKSDCRIFQNDSVIDIAKKIFEDFGFVDYEVRVIGSLEPREYCVQYRESCFDFLSRIFEEEGIFYFFEHTRDRHLLVLADSANVHRAVPLQDSYRYQRIEAGDAAAAITDWRETVQVKSGKVSLGDFNFEKPDTDLTVRIDTLNRTSYNSDLERYDYPGNYQQNAEGDRRARIRMEEEEALSRVFSGRANAPMLAPGTAFTLSDHEVKAYNGRYTLVSVRHEAVNNWDGLLEQGASYTNHFRAVAASVTYRPPRRTPRPVIEGPQTAMVVGPAGEEIFIDDYGRVKVQFHWDRRGTGNEKASCWVRVAQGWAGAQWGMQMPPRIGMEVVVEFLEGNPDRPLVTGCLYNRDAMPPYPLPGNKTRTVLKTSSSPGGGNFNELRFEDKKGAEQIFIHGGRDLDVRIKHDRREWVGASRHLIVKGSQFELAGGNRHTTVRADYNQKIDGVLNQKIGMDHHEEVGLNYAVKAGMEIALQAGMMLTIKAGGSYIALGPTGVTISGPMVLINSGGAAGSLSASPETARLPAEAATAEAGSAPKSAARRTLQKPSGNRRAAQIQALLGAAQNGTPFCEVCHNSEASPPPS